MLEEKKMEILLEITGWIHYVGLAALVAFAGSVAMITTGEILRNQMPEESQAGSVSVGDLVEGGAL
jgi:hypothetical protein